MRFFTRKIFVEIFLAAKILSLFEKFFYFFSKNSILPLDFTKFFNFFSLFFFFLFFSPLSAVLPFFLTNIAISSPQKAVSQPFQAEFHVFYRILQASALFPPKIPQFCFLGARRMKKPSKTIIKRRQLKFRSSRAHNKCACVAQVCAGAHMLTCTYARA